MIDIHTHILPGIDDGARNIDMSLAMLHMEAQQGVDTVVLTPHFYRHRERPEHFLLRRKEAYERLQDALAKQREEQPKLPKLVLGCEVAWVPNLMEMDLLPELCIGDTQNLLLELPFTPWSKTLGDQLYDLMGRTGITPILAHLERYTKIQRPELVREVLSLGLPVQISADTLLGAFSKGKSLKALKSWAHIVASDCHNTTDRAPSMEQAMQVVEKKLGRRAATTIDNNARCLITDSGDI